MTYSKVNLVKAMTLHEVKGYLQATIKNEIGVYSEDVIKYADSLLKIVNEGIEKAEKTNEVY